VDDAWVFDVASPLAAPHLVTDATARRCAALASTLGPRAVGPCVLQAAT
jgi:hypothetical protein